MSLALGLLSWHNDILSWYFSFRFSTHVNYPSHRNCLSNFILLSHINLNWGMDKLSEPLLCVELKQPAHALTALTSMPTLLAPPPPPNKMAAVSQMTFLNAFSGYLCILIKISSTFVLNDLTDKKICIGLGNCLVPMIRRQDITWINVDPVHWRIYAPLGWYELNHHWR